jgi:hypothetical protein
VNWIPAACVVVICCAHPVRILCQEPAPLPSAASVIDRVLARTDKEKAEAIEFKGRFSYCRTRTTERRNGKGELLSREVSKDRHLPTSGPAKNRPAKNPAAKQETGAKSKKSRPNGRDISVDRELLSRFAFAVTGRDQMGDRPTLILDFAPVGDAPEHNLTDRFINRIAGRVWIDEADAALVRISFHLTAKVNFVAGLAGSIRAFNFDSRRERTSEGLWFTKTNSWHLDVREVVVLRVTDYHEDLAEVQRLAPTAAK